MQITNFNSAKSFTGTDRILVLELGYRLNAMQAKRSFLISHALRIQYQADIYMLIWRYLHTSMSLRYIYKEGSTVKDLASNLENTVKHDPWRFHSH